MSAEVVNLRAARRAKARADAAAKATANRAAFGRTRARKEADAAEAERQARILDGVRREP